MKKHLLIISTLLFSVFGFSQGIEFEHGTWKEVLEKAKQTNKPIFIDVSTSWCGPCKMMVKDVFNLPEVGKVYNANFVCYMIDAEKGEGIEIAKNYKVKSYPTYLFMKSDATLFSIAMGSMSADNFIGVSKSALADMNDPKPIAIWEKEYAVKKNNPAFLLDYMQKRFKLGKSNIKLYDEYLKLLPEERRTSDTIFGFYMLEGHYLKVNSLLYANLQKYKELFIKRLPINAYLYDGIVNSVYEAAQSKDKQLLDIAILAYTETLNDPFRKSKDELYMDYYSRTGEFDRYMSYATKFCNDKLMNVSPDSIAQKDKERLLEIDALKGIDSTQIAQIKENVKHQQRNLYSEKLNNIAWEVFEKTSDKNALKDALRWSKHSLEIYPSNPLSLNTFANLLYKLGQKQEAITKEEEALRYAKKEDTTRFEKTILKMKAGEKTWEQE